MSIEVEEKRDVAVLYLDNPPVNALSAEMREVLYGHVASLQARDDIAALVITGRGACFCGGADIREFDTPERHREPLVPELVAAIEDSEKPVAAAIHGVALGGGCELTLGCHYRVGAANARMGLPEIKLGLMPGAGGTQRLPRLVGLERAAEMILTGNPVDSAAALEAGLLDAVIDGDLVDGAVAFVRKKVAAGAPLRKTSGLSVDGDTAAVLEQAKARYLRHTRGLIAPGHCIESLGNAASLPFDEGMARERALFIECRESEQSRAQRHLFFAERAASRVPGISESVRVQRIERAAIIGSGTMGEGIAVCFANAGIPLVVHDASAGQMASARARIEGIYAQAVRRGRLDKAQMEKRLQGIGWTHTLDAAASADIVIEAVVEDMPVKQALFAELDRLCPPQTILATNTSSLNIDDIADATRRPGKVMGTHFFSPANVMRLMENVRGENTSAETIATVMNLSRTLGKIAVLVGVCDGFVGNRMYHNYTRQASFLLEEGAMPEEIDRVMHEFGFSMGPFAVGDLAGLDVSWHIRLRRAPMRPPAERYSPIADWLCERGRFGQKTGAGWYRYEPDSRTPLPDAEVAALILARSDEMNLARRAISSEEIIERCVYVLVNEGARILQEGIAQRPGDIDVIWTYGYGFPVFRGGPMFYANRVGIRTIRDALMRHHDRDGDAALRPARMIEELARDKRGFYTG
jgi:3-hydroxyacyl-CoA dehydrogenase